MINIAELYPNELNLYGENGNIKALKYALEKNNINYTITQINEDDELDFSKYDFIYMGSGRPEFLKIVKKRLIPYKEDILNYLKQDKIFLVTGNALSILDFLDLYEVISCEKRIVEDINATTSLCNGVIKGFQNTEYLIKNTDNLLFNLENSTGNNHTPFEGYKYHNLYVTSIIGPILARNENLTSYFIDLLETNKN